MEPRLDLIWRWFKFLYHSMKLFWLRVDLVEDFMKMTLFEQKSALFKLICTPLWNRVTYLNHKMFVPNRFDWGSQVPFEGHGYMINSKVTCHLHWQSRKTFFNFHDQMLNSDWLGYHQTFLGWSIFYYWFQWNNFLKFQLKTKNCNFWS